MWPNESTTPSRARMRLAVTSSSIRSSSLAIGLLTYWSQSYMSVQNRGNSAASRLEASHRPSLLNFSSSPLKHIVSFARSQAMAENLVRVCTAADLPPGNVKSFEVGDERVAVYNIDGTFYATEAQCTDAAADLAHGLLEGHVHASDLHVAAVHVSSG